MCAACSVAQSRPTLCEPVGCGTPGFSVHGILQSRILEWVAMPSFRGSSQPRDRTHTSYVSWIGRQVLVLRGKPSASVLLLLSHFSRVRLCATPGIAAYQAPLSMGFARKEHWSGLPLPSPQPSVVLTNIWLLTFKCTGKNICIMCIHELFWFVKTLVCDEFLNFSVK